MVCFPAADFSVLVIASVSAFQYTRIEIILKHFPETSNTLHHPLPPKPLPHFYLSSLCVLLMEDTPRYTSTPSLVELELPEDIGQSSTFPELHILLTAAPITKIYDRYFFASTLKCWDFGYILPLLARNTNFSPCVVVCVRVSCPGTGVIYTVLS